MARVQVDGKTRKSSEFDVRHVIEWRGALRFRLPIDVRFSNNLIRTKYLSPKQRKTRQTNSESYWWTNDVSHFFFIVIFWRIYARLVRFAHFFARLN